MASAEEYKTVAEAVADCTVVVGTTAVRHRELQHPLRRLEDGVRLGSARRLPSNRVALLFGSEKFGLSNHDLSYCHWLMRIPTREGHISMNLGQAVAVSLYEFIRTARPARVPEKLKPATAAEVERITASLLEALDASGYLCRRTVADSEPSDSSSGPPLPEDFAGARCGHLARHSSPDTMEDGPRPGRAKGPEERR